MVNAPPPHAVDRIGVQQPTQTCHVALAGVASVTPPTVARTLNTCFPFRTFTLKGDVHGRNGLPSTAHSKVAPGWLAMNSKVTPALRTTFFGGRLVIVVSTVVIAWVA
jgi:hypothetical protein